MISIVNFLLEQKIVKKVGDGIIVMTPVGETKPTSDEIKKNLKRWDALKDIKKKDPDMADVIRGELTRVGTKL